MFATMTRPAVLVLVALLFALVAVAVTVSLPGRPAQAPASVEQPAESRGGGRLTHR